MPVRNSQVPPTSCRVAHSRTLPPCYRLRAGTMAEFPCRLFQSPYSRFFDSHHLPQPCGRLLRFSCLKSSETPALRVPRFSPDPASKSECSFRSFVVFNYIPLCSPEILAALTRHGSSAFDGLKFLPYPAASGSISSAPSTA